MRASPCGIGLLYRVATALEGSGVEVQWARVVPFGSSVVDSFCLAGGGENGQLRPDQRQRIERAVLTAAS
ncbi:MAG: hypothetical protein M3308_03590 [Actinomycetota bacterium]|nr:hypothetical protein [Actinomycetota bacterium]